ncbi:MAG: DUF2911 domain-containing protein [Verrucomicrobiota bacterium]|nr:DUF2911 domain-containing protein [Verrucomicrobiota bacterium]
MMSQRPNSILIVSLLCFAVFPLFAQDKPRVSPADTVSATINGNEISIAYSRPYTKDPKSGEMRKIWGGLVPYGKVWRMGANEATILKTSKALEIGGKELPAGSYSLYLWPEENGAKLIINKQTGQWGTKYDEAQDFARVDLKKEAADKQVDQFTIAIDKNGNDGGVLKMMWEKTQYSLPFKVK